MRGVQRSLPKFESSRRLYSTEPPKEPPSSSSVNSEQSAEKPAAAFSTSKTGPRQTSANKTVSDLMNNLQARLANAPQALNEMTGYSPIEQIKIENEQLENSLAKTKESLEAARLAYKASNTQRANTQREVNNLLARKDNWSPQDLERFTELYRTEHILEGEVASAQKELTDAETQEQSLHQRLYVGILKRYHEEQMWSDRIRSLSMWATLGLMGMNVLLFLIVQPWQRKRLTRGVVEGVRGELETINISLHSVEAALEAKETIEVLPIATPEPVLQEEPEVSKLIEDPTAESWKEFLTHPERWKAVAGDLVSERRKEVTMKDISVLALEAGLTGAAIAWSVAFLVLRTP